MDTIARGLISMRCLPGKTMAETLRGKLVQFFDSYCTGADDHDSTYDCKKCAEMVERILLIIRAHVTSLVKHIKLPVVFADHAVQIAIIKALERMK